MESRNAKGRNGNGVEGMRKGVKVEANDQREELKKAKEG
jgi:hypothetical protein